MEKRMDNGGWNKVCSQSGSVALMQPMMFHVSEHGDNM